VTFEHIFTKYGMQLYRKLRLFSLTFHHNHRFKRKKHTRHCTSPTEEGIWSVSHLNIISLPDLAREPIKIHLVLATKCDMLNCKSFFPDGKLLLSSPNKNSVVTESPGEEVSSYIFLGHLRARPKLALAVIRSQNSLTQFSALITDQQTYSGSPIQSNHAKNNYRGYK